MGPYDILTGMSDAPEKPKTDVVLLGPPTGDGEGVHVLRAREDRIEAGEVRPMKDGAPIHGEVVKLTPREGAPGVCDVEVSYAPPSSARAASAPSHGARGKGPPKVATNGYREGWDEIFGKRAGAQTTSAPQKRVLN